MNLMSNAIKFTKDGFVVLSVKSTKINEHNVNLHIEVKDSGIGIAKEKIDHIFK